MKNILVTAILMTLCISTFGQEPKVSIRKTEYKFDEVIALTFEIDATPDSIVFPDFKGFKVISGPNKSSSVTIKYEKKTVYESRSYRLRPIESGQLTIAPIIYYIDGKKIKGKPLKIKVAPSNMTEEELKEKELYEFIIDGIKPQGSKRITFHENKGYLEIYGEKGWMLYRRLTPEEIEEIVKIK